MYRSLPLLLVLLWLVGGCVGVTAEGVPPDDDDSSTGDDDDIGDDDDDSAGDDDDSAGDDDVVDDNTCDEGASSEQEVRFIFRDEVGNAIPDATWRVYDLDAETGVVDGTVLAEGVSSGKGHALATLDCAYGWVLMEFTAESFATSHVFFRINHQPAWPTSVITAAYLDEVIGEDIASPEAGFLAVIKNAADIAPDLQGEDSCTIDGGYELIPWDATDDIGIFVFDGAFATNYFGLWYVDYELPGAGTVIEFRYEDVSSERVFLAHLPVWSFVEGDARHMTLVNIAS